MDYRYKGNNFEILVFIGFLQKCLKELPLPSLCLLNNSPKVSPKTKQCDQIRLKMALWQLSNISLVSIWPLLMEELVLSDIIDAIVWLFGNENCIFLHNLSNCNCFPINIDQNWDHIDQNTHLQTLTENLTDIYLFKPNLT